jgi:hypothetical protein
LDIGETFRLSATKTIEQLVESVQVVDAPVSASSLAERGLAGMIIIQPDTLVARIQFIEGFWSGTADSTVEISASISVDGKEGRLLGTSASGDGNAQQQASTCGDGAAALGLATEKALKELLGQLGERLSNSSRMR